MQMCRWNWLSLLSVFFLIPLSHAQTAVDETLAQKIRAIVGQRHPDPGHWNQLQQLAEGSSVDHLIETLGAMIQRTSSPMEKSRLIEALGQWTTPEARQIAKSLAEDPQQSSIVRQISLRTVGTQLSKQATEDGVELLEKSLNHEDANIRLSAAMGLERAQSNSAVQAKAKSLLDSFKQSGQTQSWMLAALRSAEKTSAPSKVTLHTSGPHGAPAAPGAWDGFWMSFSSGKTAVSRKATFRIGDDFAASIVFSGQESIVFEKGQFEVGSGLVWSGRYKDGPCKARLLESFPLVIECVCPQSGFVFLGR